MNQWQDRNDTTGIGITPQGAAGARSAAYDAGLRAYMLRVYNYMGGALALTGVLAWLAANSNFFLNLMYNMEQGGGMTPIGWIIALAPLGIVFYLSFRVDRLSYSAAQTWFWAFAGLMGLSLSSVFLAYTGTSIARVFFITAGTFGAMSLYGYTTKRDLTSWGSFLFMGLIGLIIASIVNIFLQSTTLHYILGAVGVLIFVGLTAYDTQKIKSVYYSVAGNAEALGKAAVMGALNLYLDFINLFLMLLRFFGERR